MIALDEWRVAAYVGRINCYLRLLDYRRVQQLGKQVLRDSARLQLSVSDLQTVRGTKLIASTASFLKAASAAS